MSEESLNASRGLEPAVSGARAGGGEFTPGPWIVEEASKTLWVGMAKAWAHKVSEVVYVVDIGPEYTDAANVKRRANAALISAAPDLLAIALRSVEPFGDLTDDEVKAVFDKGVSQFCVDTRAAIAKALGTSTASPA